MRIYENILETVGKTPLIKLRRLTSGCKGTVVVKHEAFNPGGSVKDRIAIHMVDEAERTGKLKPGGTIIECTSGNTGLGLAITAAVRGYKAIFTMPDKVAAEKSSLLRAFGAEVRLAPTAVEPDDPKSYYSVAKRLSETIENSYYPNQYQNPMNPDAHYQTTGPEIWEDTDGKITYYVAGMGTGGTISGIGKFLKEKNPDIKVIGADPVGSLYTEYFETGELGEAHTYKIEGIGEDMLPTTMDFSVIDEVIQVGDREAFRMARRLARIEGIFSGSSAGCVMEAAMQVVPRLSEDDLMVIIIPDTGERYLSKVYNEDWLRENQLLDSQIAMTVGEILARKQSPLREIISVDSAASILDAVNLMRDNDVSQVPVTSNGEVVGSVREAGVIPFLLQGAEATSKEISEIMEPAFPVVAESAAADEIFLLLSKTTPAVIVPGEGGKLRILTKWDLIHSVSGKS